MASDKLRCTGQPKSCEDAAYRKFKAAIDAATIRSHNNFATHTKYVTVHNRTIAYKPILPADEEPEHLGDFRAETQFENRRTDIAE